MRRTQSAGGVVINPQGHVLVVNQRGSSWSLPKGHIDPGESAEAAARREIYEEAGVSEVELVGPLGSYERHRIGLNGGDDPSELKTIHMFLYRTKQMDLEPQDPNHPEARWVEKDGVADLLTHARDKEFFRKITGQIPG